MTIRVGRSRPSWTEPVVVLNLPARQCSRFDSNEKLRKRQQISAKKVQKTKRVPRSENEDAAVTELKSSTHPTAYHLLIHSTFSSMHAVRLNAVTAIRRYVSMA
jgi:hypothetical protein